MMRILGIESSCDETAAAIVKADGELLSEVVHSQIALHAPYGGVVPEIAARDHLRAAVAVIAQCLDEAGLALADIDGIAVTHRPGLVGALLVGLQTAKGLAWGADKPLIGVDHLLGHLLSVFVRRPGDAPTLARFPFIGLLVSGGHTAIYRCEGTEPTQIFELGATRDDAVGEAFDKVAKLLGLGYPGGPVVDRLAAIGNHERAPVALPTPMPRSLEFSFSGIKSAVSRHVRAHPPADEQAVADLCAAFQRVVTHTLVAKTVRAAAAEGIARIVVAGGVAANSGLRRRMANACRIHNLELFIPPIAGCTDNAAMIAYAGSLRLAAGQVDGFALPPLTRTALPSVTRKGRGPRR